MKAKELRERSDQELAELSAQVKKELFHHRMRNATGQLSDTSQLGKAKKTLARINLIVGERARAAARSQSAGSEA